MLESATLDQLRAFAAVADEGSFSAAARRLGRVQSAVSHAMANLEEQLGVRLWDRATRVPTLTDGGRVLLDAARRVLDDADALGALARNLEGGLEPSVSVCVDAIFPVAALVELCRGFARAFPGVQLRLETETMQAVATRVADGRCQLGICGPTGRKDGLERRHLASVLLVPVASAGHPLAEARGPIGSRRLRDEVQIVLSEREGKTPDQGVLSRRTWRVVDLFTKRELVRGGLGWGNLPEPMVRDDLGSGALVRLRPAAWADDEHLLPLALVHRPGLPFGPALRWVAERAAALCAEHVRPGPPRRKRKR